jgi:hypothetical protein
MMPVERGRRHRGRRSGPQLLVSLALVLFAISACGGGQSNSPDPAANAERIGAMTASGRAGPLFVESAWIPAPPGPVYPAGSNLTMELLLENFGSTWDRVMSCSSPVSAHSVLRGFGAALDFISVPAGKETVEGQVQMFDIRRTLSPGDLVTVTLLHSADGGLTLRVPVQDRTT